MRRLLITAPLLTLLAVACTGTDTYKDQTQDFLNDKSEVETQVGGDVSDANCVEPSSTDVGETYTCTAEVAGVGTATFTVEIDKKDSFLVTGVEF